VTCRFVEGGIQSAAMEEVASSSQEMSKMINELNSSGQKFKL